MPNCFSISCARPSSQYLYLVGDIVDIWRMRRAWYWRQEHNDVVQKLLRKARKGTRVIYVPGNHDESFRDFAGHRFGRVAVLPRSDPHRRGRPAVSGPARRSVRRRRQVRQVAGVRRRPCLQLRAVGQRVVQRGPPQARLSLLVAVRLSEAQGQERRRVRQQLRERGGRGSPAPRRRRRHLRPHPHAPRSAASTAFSTATTATGWKAARRWSSTSTAGWKSCGGQRCLTSLAMSPVGEWRMRILVVTDAWFPQVNGVVRTLDALRGQLEASGIGRPVLPRTGFSRFPARLIRRSGWRCRTPGTIDRLIADIRPSAIHIATEGPLGLIARWCCRRRRLPFTTSFHTRFPEYVHARWSVPLSLDLRLAALVPRGRILHHGLDAVGRGGVARARLREHQALVPRRRYRGCFGRAARPSSTIRAR